MHMDMDASIVELLIAECERTGCHLDEVLDAIQSQCLNRRSSDLWRAGIAWTDRCMDPILMSSFTNVLSTYIYI